MDQEPNEQEVFLVIQQYLVSFGLDLLFTGIYTCMICFILYFFCSSRRCRAQKSSKILLGAILVMFVIRLVHVGNFWFQIWYTFVEHGDSRDSVLSAYYAAPNLTTGDVTVVLLIAIADSVMVWRCWIISSSNVNVTLTPFVLNFVAIVLGLVYISLDRPGADTPPLAVLMSTLNMAFSVATTFSSTMIIAIRIMMVGKVPGEMRAQSRYSKPLAIITESSALYTIAVIVDMPFFAILSNFTEVTYEYVDIIAQNMTVIAPALIMLRVLIGKEQEPSEGQSRSKVTTLRFEHDQGSEHDQQNATTISHTQVSRGEVADIGCFSQSEKEIV